METFKIEVNGNEIFVKENETILNASIRQAGNIFVGYKGGACGMCKIKITIGETVMGYTQNPLYLMRNMVLDID